MILRCRWRFRCVLLGAGGDLIHRRLVSGVCCCGGQVEILVKELRLLQAPRRQALRREREQFAKEQRRLQRAQVPYTVCGTRHCMRRQAGGGARGPSWPPSVGAVRGAPASLLLRLLRGWCVRVLARVLIRVLTYFYMI